MHLKTRLSLCTRQGNISPALRTINSFINTSMMQTKHLKPTRLVQRTLIFFCLSVISVAPAWSWSNDPTVNTAISTAANYQLNPQITSDGAGGSIITWPDSRNGEYDIYAQRINAAGAAQWTANGVAISTTTDSSYNSQIISDGAGGAIITWGEGTDIYAQRINGAGAAQWTANGVAISTAAYWQASPQITSDGAGGAIITWNDDRNNNDDWNIYAQRVDGAGATQWTADGVAICTDANWQNFPQITSDGAGGAIITWTDFRNSNPDLYDNANIYAQRVNAAGAVQWTTDGVAISTAPTEQGEHAITSDGAGGVIITWVDYRNSNDWNIYAQRVNAVGVAQWTAEGVAVSTADNDQRYVQITSDGDEGAIITWGDYRNGNDWNIYAQCVNAAGAVQWTVNGIAISTATNVQREPQITSDGDGGAIITWGDYRNADYLYFVTLKHNITS